MIAGVLTVPGIDFELPTEVVVLGVITGVAYGLFGLGLTLTYQNSRVLNFAQGAMGTLPHLLLAALVIDHDQPYWVALAAALAVSAAAGALLQFLVVRRLSRAPRLVVLVATIGAAQILVAPVVYLVNLSRSGMAQSPYPTPFDASWTVGSLRLQSGHILILLVAPLLVGGLTWFLRSTSLGAASRAMSENDEAAQLSGVPVQWVSLAVWTIAGLLAGLAAILAGPTKPIISGNLAGGGIQAGGDILLRGLGAAMIGGLASMPQVFVAGLGLGLVEALIRWNYPASNSLELVMMVIIVGSLLLRRDLRQAARGAEESSWSLSGVLRDLPEWVRCHPRVRAARWIGLGMLAAVAVLAPIGAPPGRIVLYSAIVLYALIGLSLVVLIGWGGQVSLGHFAFVALGALVGGRLHELGYPRFGAIVGAVAVGAIAAAAVGIPALRIRGLFLAVTTLAFAVVVNSWLLGQSWLVHISSTSNSMSIPRPSWGGLSFQPERNYYYLCLGLLVVTAVAVHHFKKTGVARTIMAVRDNEPMAASLSISPTMAKIVTFVLSGAMASFAGYFYAGLLTNFRYARLAAPQLSQDTVVMVVFGGVTSITGAVLGAVYVRGIPYFFDADWVQLLSSGVGLLLVLMLLPGGLAALAFRVRDRVVALLVPGAWRADGPADVGTMPVLRVGSRRTRADAEGPAAIEAADIAVHFDGVQALRGASMHARPGEIIGLIGPNGAGKTTLFDVLSGHVKADRGRVLLNGVDVTTLPPEYRATMGLARSFQQAKLFGDLSVIDVLKVALERDDRSETIPSLLALPPSIRSERRKDERAKEILELLGLGPVAYKSAAELSTGTRRVVELGCVVALGARTLLLDEPTAGIAQREVEAFTPLLRQLHDHLDATTVVVAHDIPMIRGLVDRVYVLAAGEVIVEGPPDEVMEHPLVVASYLGTDEPSEALPADALVGT